MATVCIACAQNLGTIIYLPISFGVWILGGIRRTVQQIANNTVGRVIRNNMFFPDPHKKFSPSVFKECKEILNPDVLDPSHYPTKVETLKLFNKEKKTITFKSGNTEFCAKILIFNTNFPRAKNTHTCIRIGGGDETLSLTPMRIMPFLSSYYDLSKQDENLCFMQLSLFGIKKKSGEDFTLWKPLNFKQTGQIVFPLLGELKKQGFSIDSMICHSMGSAILENLENRDPQEVPNTLILDRALPSVWKAGNILNPVIRYLVYFLAYCSAWSGDPERSLTAFYRKLKTDDSNPISERKVIILEAENDYYFSGNGAFDKNLASNLSKLGASTFQGKFKINPLRTHPRAQHAATIDSFCNMTGKTIEQGKFSINPGENLASAIVRNIFLKNTKKG
ncbi:MAG: hypothetical protein K1000chlam3_01145 [Chlamydiae bacterium]|nr:hypothetical protein [Chlamydiota bacterium]